MKPVQSGAPRAHPAEENPLNARVFRAFYKTFQSEGFSKDELYQLSKRGADLLTASDAPSDRASEKPASAAAGGNAADNTSSDSLYTYLFSNPTITRRLALTAFTVLLALGAATVFSAVLDLARAPRIERSVGRVPDRRLRSISLVFSTGSLLFLIIGLIMFAKSDF